MKYQHLSNTSDLIPRIGQGTVGLHRIKQNQAVQLIQYGIDLGMTLIDTADSYANGECEIIVGKAIEKKRDDVFICTKFSASKHEYESVLSSVENSLTRLKIDCIDLYQVHWPNYEVPLEETMSALLKAQSQGKIKHIGVCNFDTTEIAGIKHSIKSNQVEYSLDNRFIEDSLLPYCQKNNITVMAYSPMNKGRKISHSLDAISIKYDKTPHQIMLNWLLCREGVVVIPRSTKRSHICDNAAAADVQLKQSDIQEIERTFSREIQYIPCNQIHVISSGEGSTNVYKTFEEAMENKLKFIPSPQILAEQIKKGCPIKPIYLVPSEHGYNLMDGPLRYWAWFIAHNGQPIPSYVFEKDEI